MPGRREVGKDTCFIHFFPSYRLPGYVKSNLPIFIFKWAIREVFCIFAGINQVVPDEVNHL